MMATPAVTEVTRNAGVDLADQDYMDIYEELRRQRTLRQFVEMLDSRYSIGWWSKYERGDVQLTRAARNELRLAVGLGALPRLVEEVVSDVDPNAVVYRVGELRPNKVIMVGHDQALVMRLNGTLTIEDVPQNTPVTAVTGRRQRVSLSVGYEIGQRLNEARLAAGLTWTEFLSRLLEE